MRKLIPLIYMLLIVGAYMINHQIYGNSHTTTSYYEILKFDINMVYKRWESKKIADYMYERILYWQQEKER